MNIENTPDDDGNYPIHRVIKGCEAKNADVRKLLELGADIDAKNANGRTALHLACLVGAHHIVKLLIAEGADVNARDNNGYCPMHMAVEGSNSSIKLLVEAGAAIDCLSNNNKTPLLYACEIGKVGAIKNLCELGANANIDKYSDKSLVRIVIRSFSSIFPSNAQQMVSSLIKAGATIGAKDIKTGKTELHLVAVLTRDKWNGLNFNNILRLLIKAGGNPWEKDSEGNSPLMLMNAEGLASLAPVLKRYIKNREIKVVSLVEEVIELKAFFFNQTKFSKKEVFDLLREGSPAKYHFEETLALPPIQLEQK